MKADDLIERLEAAERRLLAMADGAVLRGEVTSEAIRLRGKAEGVLLAASYVRESRVDVEEAPDTAPHRRSFDICSRCLTDWPCPTVSALGEQE